MSSAVGAMAESQKESAKSVAEAVKGAVDSGSKAVLLAIAKIRTPDMGDLGTAIADALASLERSNATMMRMMSESNDRLAQAVTRLVEQEVRESQVKVVEVQRPDPPKPSGWRTTITRGENGEMKEFTLTPMDGGAPTSSMQAAMRAIK